MNSIITDEHTIQNKIFTVRDLQVMLDADLAELYGVQTKRINEAVRNNPDKFPSDFYFELSKEEDEILRSKISTFNESLKNRKYSSKVFTEQGVYMLATVLKSKIATEITISIIRTFAQMRRIINDNSLFLSQLKDLEKRQLSYEIKTDKKLDEIFEAIEAKEIKPKQGIFYEGQIFDAYVFVSELIKSAKNSIVLFDNYVDESVLMLLSKRVSTCNVIIYTKTISKRLELDLQKYNAQYPHIEIKKFDLSHDRFLLIDDEVYHIGASLKDLGKKWFAFSKMDQASFEIMKRLNLTDGKIV
ncbi:ORF6N domain-containing protein [Sulfurimonas sp. HSL-1716]|uniref:ORF6N domain-containing protein n=1 Tax=Hydrocurvibacter sulfurireducens TaxID=3131937 RepID=UPI0031F77A25